MKTTRTSGGKNKTYSSAGPKTDSTPAKGPGKAGMMKAGMHKSAPFAKKGC